MRAYLSPTLIALFSASLLVTACGSDPAEPISGVKSNAGDNAGGSSNNAGGSSNGESGSAGTAGTGNDTDPLGGGGASSGTKYPAGPYGLSVGSIVQNYEFLGLTNPKASSYDTGTLTKISFADFYNPEGAGDKPKFLLVTASARWCVYCKEEASHSMKAYEQYQPQGVEFLTTIFEDDASPPNPAVASDLQKWTKSYSLAYPVALDPKLQLGAFFNVSAAPFNMIVDTSTMTIVWKNEGAVDFSKAGNPLDQVLAK